MQHETIKWEAEEYEYRKKRPDWYWALGIITISGSIAAFLIGNILFGIFILFAGFSLYFFSTRKPEKVVYEISQEHLRIGDFKYPWENLNAFFIKTEGSPILLIESNRLFMPILILPVPDFPIDSLEKILESHIPKKKIEEPASERLMHYFGF